MIVNLFPVESIAPPPPEDLGSWSISVTHISYWWDYYVVSVTFTPYTLFVSSGVNWNISCQDYTPTSSTWGDAEAKVEYNFDENPSGFVLNLTATRADGVYQEDYIGIVP